MRFTVPKQSLHTWPWNYFIYQAPNWTSFCAKGPFVKWFCLPFPPRCFLRIRASLLLMRRLERWEWRWIVLSHTANWVRVGDFSSSPPVFKECIQHPDEPHQKPWRASLFHCFGCVATDTAETKVNAEILPVPFSWVMKMTIFSYYHPINILLHKPQALDLGPFCVWGCIFVYNSSPSIEYSHIVF